MNGFNRNKNRLKFIDKRFNELQKEFIKAQNFEQMRSILEHQKTLINAKKQWLKRLR